MFTSRAEYRILLRQDNSDLRLTPLVAQMGMQYLGDRMENVAKKEQSIKVITDFFLKTSVAPDQVNGYLESVGSQPMKIKNKLHQILIRPHISMTAMAEHLPFVKEFIANYPKEHLETAEVAMKYKGYIRKEQELVDKMNRLEEVKLKTNIDYHEMKSLSSEAREKLTAIKPATIGQASRISGVTPSGISVLLVYMGR